MKIIELFRIQTEKLNRHFFIYELKILQMIFFFINLIQFTVNLHFPDSIQLLFAQKNDLVTILCNLILFLLQTI